MKKILAIVSSPRKGGNSELDAPTAMERTMNALQGYVDCIPGSGVKGKIYGQAFAVGEIKEKSAMGEAYELGRQC